VIFHFSITQRARNEESNAFTRKNIDLIVTSLPGNFESINSHQFTFVSKKNFYVLKRRLVWLLRWLATLKALTLISSLFSQKKRIFYALKRRFFIACLTAYFFYKTLESLVVPQVSRLRNLA
jgi:hypothetical protein